jgi:hypothetical protein
MERNVFRGGLIERVREGMQVLDFEGNRIGAVEMVKMGDAEATTTRGEEPTPQAGVMPMSDESYEPEVDEPLRSELVRVGFLKIGGGLFGADRYVPADAIERVEGDNVFIRVPERRLPKEDGDDLAHEVQPDDRVRPGEREGVMPPPAIGLGMPNRMQ